MKRLIELTPVDLSGAALSIVIGQGHVESSRMADLVARELTGSYLSDPFVHGLRAGQHRELRTSETNFASRVRGQLDQLAAKDLIVKVGAHGTLPNGYGAGGLAHYYSPAAYDSAQQKHSDELKAKLAERRRWSAISARLSAGADIRLDARHQLTVDAWEQLLEQAGW